VTVRGPWAAAGRRLCYDRIGTARFYDGEQKLTRTEAESKEGAGGDSGSSEDRR
jgi:hypothetical protein